MTSRLLFLVISALFFFSGLARAQDLNDVTLVVPEKYRQGVFGDKLALKAMPGLKVSVFYAGSPGARFMAADKSGTIYLSVPEDGVVLAHAQEIGRAHV